MEEKIQEEKMNESKEKRDYLLPASILIAAILVSVSLVYNAGKVPAKNGGNDLSGTLVPTSQKNLLDNLKPLTEADHILGSVDAPVKIVEFSDLECPFCKQFHATMKQVVAFYGGKVVWAYRHFPLDVLHPRARKEAEASECANELGGNAKFWAFIDGVFQITPSNNGLDPTLLPKIAGDIGLNVPQFESCLQSGKYASKVQAGVDEAQSAGGQGTPYSIVISKSGKKYTIPGALPYEAVKQIIDEAIKN